MHYLSAGSRVIGWAYLLVPGRGRSEVEPTTGVRGLSFILWLHVDTAVFRDRLMSVYYLHLTMIGMALGRESRTA